MITSLRHAEKRRFPGRADGRTDERFPVRIRRFRIARRSFAPARPATPAGPVLALRLFPGRRVEERKIVEVITFIHAPVPRAYAGWTACDMLPRFMRNVEGPCDGTAAGWMLHLRHEEVPWDGHTSEVVPLKRIAWEGRGHSAPCSRGLVCFNPVGARTTKVCVVIDFDDSFAVTEETLKSLRSALEHRVDLLHLHLQGSVLGPCPPPL